MKKTVVSLLSLTALSLAVLAQAPSPAPAPEAENAPPPQPRERMQRGPGGDRQQRAGRMGGMENREMGMERMLGAMVMNPEFSKKLNITADQQAALKKLMENQRAKLTELQTVVANAAKKQAELMLAEPLDEAALMAVVEETGTARTALAKASITMLIETRKVLTEEQRKQLRELVTQMRTRRTEQAGPPRERMRERQGEQAPVVPVPPPPAP